LINGAVINFTVSNHPVNFLAKKAPAWRRVEVGKKAG